MKIDWKAGWRVFLDDDVEVLGEPLVVLHGDLQFDAPVTLRESRSFPHAWLITEHLPKNLESRVLH